MNNHIVLIQGFMEKGSRFNSGIYKLYKNILSKTDAKVTLLQWNSNLEETIESIKNSFEYQLYDDSNFPKINIIGYSYGGYSASILSKRLDDFDIQNLFLIDPVWRVKYNRPSFKSFDKTRKIKVSNNVKKTYLFRQDVKKRGIKGHDVETNGIVDRHDVQLRHGKIDNSEVIHSFILNKLGLMV